MKRMMIAVWCLLTVQSCGAKELPRIQSIEGSYRYGIRIEDNATAPTPEKDFQDEHETISIYQKQRLINRIETFRSYPLYFADLDADGKKELIFKIFDGGDRFDWVVATIEPKMKPPAIFKNMAELSTLEEIGGKPRLITWECYGAIFSAQNACVKIVADYDGGKFHLDKEQMGKGFSLLKMPKTPAKIRLDDRGYLETDNSRPLMAIIAYVMQAFYAGESQKAIDLLRRSLRTEDRATTYLFIQELVDELSLSRFWKDIVSFNGWQSEDYDLINGTMLYHPKDWKKEEVVRHLFKMMMEKTR